MKIGTITRSASTTSVDSDRRTVTQDSSTSSVTRDMSADDASALVQLSPEATALSNAGADTSFDSEKVERIAQAIRDGKFRVDPDAIADKLLSNAQEVLSGYASTH
jgi:negative regulator of flagellin synthesis FlgM